MSDFLTSLTSSLLGAAQDTRTSESQSGSDLFGQSLLSALMPQASGGATASGAAGGTQPLVASGSAGGSAREEPLSDIAVTDRNGDGSYGRQDVTKVSSIKDTAATIVEHVGKNPEVKATFMGETHGDQGDALYFETLTQAKAAGQNPMAVIETPTTPALDKMIEDLYAGKFSSTEEFVKKGAEEMFRAYNEAKETMGPVSEEAKKEQVGLEYFENRLRNDVVKFYNEGIPVAFFDDGRFQPGGNRDAAMADKIEQLIAKNPDNELYIQAGMLHGQERSSLPYKDSVRDGYPWKGVQQAAFDEERPAAERLSDRLGDDAVLTLALDEYSEFGKSAGPQWEGKPYLQFADKGVTEVDYKKTDGTSGIRSITFDYVVPVYDESKYKEPKPFN